MIAARAKAERAEIHWGNESGLRSDDERGRSYATKGETPLIRVNNKPMVTKLAPARIKLQLVKATAHHLRSVQRQPERIRKYFEHSPVPYAA